MRLCKFWRRAAFGVPIFYFHIIYEIIHNVWKNIGEVHVVLPKGHSHDPDMRTEFIQQSHEGNSSYPVNSA